jgi:hypothetical protein
VLEVTNLNSSQVRFGSSPVLVVKRKDRKKGKFCLIIYLCSFIFIIFDSHSCFFYLSLKRMVLRRSNRGTLNNRPKKPPPPKRPGTANKKASKQQKTNVAKKTLDFPPGTAAVAALPTPAPPAPAIRNPYAKKKPPPTEDKKPASVVQPVAKTVSYYDDAKSSLPTSGSAIAATAPSGNSFDADPLEAILNGNSARGQVLSDKETLAFSHAMVFKKMVGKISTNSAGVVVVDPFKSTINPTGDCINDVQVWASYCINQDDLFGDETAKIKHNTGNKTENDKAKVSQVARFLRSIRDHNQLGALAELIDDAEGGKTLRFLPLIRGLSTDVKRALLNTLFCVWSFNFHFPDKPKEDASSTYQPNYTDKVARQIWKVLHDQGVTMNHSEFQHYTGSYWAYFKGRFSIAVRIRSDFARNPLRAAVEYDDEVKMRSSDMDIVNDYSTLLTVAIYKLSRDWCTRGGDEVSFLILHIIDYYVYTSKFNCFSYFI